MKIIILLTLPMLMFCSTDSGRITYNLDKVYYSSVFLECINENDFCDCISREDFPIVLLSDSSFSIYDTRYGIDEFNILDLIHDSSDKLKFNFGGVEEYLQVHNDYLELNVAGRTVEYSLICQLDTIVTNDQALSVFRNKFYQDLFESYGFNSEKVLGDKIESVYCCTVVPNYKLVQLESLDSQYLIRHTSSVLEIYDYKQSYGMSIEEDEIIDTTLIYRKSK